MQQIVQTLGLDDRLDAPLISSQAGQAWLRVAIARALAVPAIILADEPTTIWIPKPAVMCEPFKVTSQKVRPDNRNDHSHEGLAPMADRIIRIEDGRIRLPERAGGGYDE